MASGGSTELTVTCADVADLLESARRARHHEDRRGLVQVMATAPSAIAQVAPADELGAVAAAVNKIDNASTFYVDRWSATVQRAR